MSVLIKGMEMPQRCMGCTLCYVGHMGDLMCEVLRRPISVSDETGRDKFCPLIEIPTPHGRLIDADFEEQHYTSMTTNPTPDVTEQDKHNSLVIVRALQMAKTIIEAEE